MRFLKVLLSLVVLRRLPCGCFFGWILRLVVWALIALGIGKIIIKFLHRNDVVETPPPAWQFPTEPVRTTSVSSPADVPGQVANLLNDLDPALKAEAEAVVAAVNQAIAEALEAETAAVQTRQVTSDSGDTLSDLFEAAEEVAEPLPVSSAEVRTWIANQEGEDCPEGYPVKAKASSMIYYTEDDGRYELTNADVCFATPEAAEAAGYRPPKTRRAED